MFPSHRLVLSTCSEYFQTILSSTRSGYRHPIIILKDIKKSEIEALLNYMYIGEVNVLQSDLGGLIKAAECLKIKGLAVPEDDPSSSKKRPNKENEVSKSNDSTSERTAVSSPASKRLKLSNNVGSPTKSSSQNEKKTSSNG